MLARPPLVPGAWPVLGHAGRFKPPSMLPFFEAQAAERGDVFRIKLFNKEVLVFRHPDQMEHVLLSGRDNYVKGSSYDVVRDLMGMGLVTLEGDAWKAHRRLAQPAFHKRSLRTLIDTMSEVCERWFDGLRARLPEGGVIDAHREMTRLTLDIVVAALFGRQLDDHSSVSYETLTGSLEVLSDFAGVPVPRWIPTPNNLRFKRIVRELDAVIYGFIAGGRAAMARGEDDGSLLSMLLQAQDEDGAGLSDQELRDELITLFIAGHDTTALTMSWFFTLATPEREVMARLQEEVDGLTGDRPDFGALMGMRWMRQVTEELLRLRPAAAGIMRDAVGEDTLGGYQVLPGDMVMPSFWLLHRHPDFWPDAERFDPSRFDPDAVKARHSWAWLPFSGGPRVCIGNSFSMAETALIVAHMLRRAEVELVPGQDIEPWPVATLRPSTEVKVSLRWRP